MPRCCRQHLGHVCVVSDIYRSCPSGPDQWCNQPGAVSSTENRPHVSALPVIHSWQFSSIPRHRLWDAWRKSPACSLQHPLMDLVKPVGTTNFSVCYLLCKNILSFICFKLITCKFSPLPCPVLILGDLLGDSHSFGLCIMPWLHIIKSVLKFKLTATTGQV